MSDQSSAPRSSLLEIIAEEAITGVMAFDVGTGKSIFLNRCARESLELGIDGGGERGEITVSLKDLFSTDTRLNMTPFSEEILGFDGYYQNVVMRKRDGGAIIVNLDVKHIESGSLPSRKLIMFDDITLQKKLQREIEVKQDQIDKSFAEILEQNRQLKDLDLAKDRFIALTTHELRTPLSAIVATAEVLDMKLYENDAQRDEFIKTIYEQGLHLMELVNDILDFAKIQAGKMELFIERFDPVPLIAKLAVGFEHMAAQASVSIQMKKPEQSTLVYGDILRMKEVVNNVVSNAIKYNKPNGQVSISFEFYRNQDRRYFRIAIADTGQGIPANKLHHVFNEFETVGNVSRHHKGTGLGMPISKRLMNVVGGELSLESVEGQGSTFFVDIPLDKVLADDSLYRSRAESWSEDFAA
jgi:signal transduction histidine kinase